MATTASSKVASSSSSWSGLVTCKRTAVPCVPLAPIRSRYSSRARQGNPVAPSLSRPGLNSTSSYLGRQVPISVANLRRPSGRTVKGGALVTLSGTVEKVTAKELDDILLNERTKPIVIDFYATWCGPCIMLAQELKELSAELGDRVRFLKVDTDEETVLAGQLRIQGLPTMVFVSDDKEKNAIRTEGLLSQAQIKEIIEKEL